MIANFNNNKVKKSMALLLAAVLVIVGSILYTDPVKAQEGVYKYIVVIDPGHGGEDNGAVLSPQQVEEIFALADVDMDMSYKGQEIKEKDLTLALAQSMEAIANNIGGNDIKVYLTRQDDVRVSLEERASIANAIGGICIVLHYNIAQSSDDSGSEIYFYKEIDSESQRLAETIQAKLTRDLGTIERGIKPWDMFMLRTVKGQVVDVEVAFLSNGDDLSRILSEGFTEKAALSLLNGLRQYFGLDGEIEPMPN